MSNFRSLLSTFQTAAGLKNENTSKDETKSLKLRITEMININEIKSCYLKKKNLCDDEAKNEVEVHVAICVCIVDSFPHESIWKYWMEETGGSFTTTSGIQISASASLIIHAKFPDDIRSGWVRSKTMEKSYEPNWNDYRIIRAMLAMASEALKNNKTTHLLFCTESCIPITSLQKFAEEILIDNNNSKKENMNCSFLNVYGRGDHSCSRFDELQCFDPLTPYIPSCNIHKALPGWIVLCKRHASEILELVESLSSKSRADAFNSCEYTSIFKNVWAPEEVFFATCCSILGHLKDKSIVFKSLVYVEWDDRAKGKDRAHPITFPNFSHDLCQRARSSGCLIMRKFKTGVPLKDWRSIVLNSNNNFFLLTKQPSLDLEESSPKKRMNFNNDQNIRNNEKKRKSIS